jgi:hypothetical protein
MIEIWKDIPGYEGIYQASSLGRIKSLKRIAELRYKYKRTIRERILKLVPDNFGYYKVSLHKDKKIKTIKVHKLVALTFIKNEENKREVNHIDGNKKNNKPDNLEWCSRSENMKHAFKNGLHNQLKGERHGKSKLKKKDVINIKKKIKAGLLLKEIANEYNVTKATISSIKRRKSWRHLKD